MREHVVDSLVTKVCADAWIGWSRHRGTPCFITVTYVTVIKSEENCGPSALSSCDPSAEISSDRGESYAQAFVFAAVICDRHACDGATGGGTGKEQADCQKLFRSARPGAPRQVRGVSCQGFRGSRSRPRWHVGRGY